MVSKGALYIALHRRKKALYVEGHLHMHIHLYTSSDVTLRCFFAIMNILFNFSTVFMGFLADGHYLVSYTCHPEGDAVLPSYKYKLQWWIFIPYRPLIKVITCPVHCMFVNSSCLK